MAQQKLSTCLWFNGNAKEAVSFYTSVFKDAEVGKTAYYSEGAPLPKGTVLTIELRLLGHDFVALNAGPEFNFTPAISFVINCKDQEEIDYYWHKLSADPAYEQCGWLKDKFGISWQVVPAILNEMMTDQDESKSERVMQALLKMKKLNIEVLQKASKG
ncbi:VOC family protein [Pontibacter sp. H259]|uniref:VOC family protein n=1 Tax=Pontibacter sp. H259 TaxID=3133421 RepID=UPI0030BBE38E